MDIGKKAIIAGAVLFCLGGLSVYLLMAPKKGLGDYQPITTQPVTTQPAAAQGIQPESASVAMDSTAGNSASDKDEIPEMTHAAFVAEAEARREKQIEDKAEAERIEKLLKEKQNSVECKFWKQQQKNSSAAAKIEERINHFCNLPAHLQASQEDSAADANSNLQQDQEDIHSTITE